MLRNIPNETVIFVQYLKTLCNNAAVRKFQNWKSSTLVVIVTVKIDSCSRRLLISNVNLCEILKILTKYTWVR